MKNNAKKITELPKAPGVYFFRGAKREVLYVGKATSLRDRVRQYFSGHDTRGERIERLVAQATDIETIQTDSVLEALILEAELIRTHKPKYNIDGKDDKSFSFFVITKERFPRVVIVRQTDFDKEQFQDAMYRKGKIYGPYTSRDQMKIALKIIRRIFPFHDRSEQSEKGCLHYQMGLCPGPYDGAISEADYKRNMRNIALFLSGHKKALLEKLEKQMRALAKKEKFEEADKVKRQIFALTHINDIALMKKDIAFTRFSAHEMRVEAYDISHIGGEAMVASMIVFINGVADKSQYRKFKVQSVQGIDDVGAMREVLARRLNHLDDWGIPQLIVLDGGKGHLNMADDLWQKLDINIPVIAVAKGPTRKKVDVYKSAFFPVNHAIITDKELLESMREEAHRFAISFHKKTRDKDRHLH
ncbi:MAG: GIY-YIG nuclease family protein [Parcubacteria group bacterium]|jgi:excinuclease ABC subunit C